MTIWYQVIPRRLTYTNIAFWLGIWSEDLPDGDIVFRLSTQGRLVHRYSPEKNSWMKRGTPPENRVWHRWVEFGDLQFQPSTDYVGELIVDGSVKSSGIVRSLPTRIPTVADVGAGLEKPFNIFVGSCYYQRNDPDAKVPDAYVRLCDNPLLKPDIKFLCGDQIYFDQPPSDFIWYDLKNFPWEDSYKWIREHLTKKYRNTWKKLTPLLSRGATYMLSDDHEYWNDYPRREGAPWVFHDELGMLSELIKTKTEQFAEAFQLVQLKDTFKIGSDIEFFVFDTRRNRSMEKKLFANQGDFESAISWIKNLKSPGVLVMSSPIFVTEKSYASEGYLFDYVGDHNLPYFEDQFVPLVHELLESKVDIVVVSGDPHFSRTAIAEIGGPHPHKIVEVISSAMATIDDAPGIPKPGPYYFPMPSQAHPQIPSARIQYRQYSNRRDDKYVYNLNWAELSKNVAHMVREGKSIDEINSFFSTTIENSRIFISQAVDNFVTLSFTRDPINGGIGMAVRSWMCKRRDNSDVQVPVDFEDRIMLYGEKRPIAENISWLIPVITVLS